MPGDEYFVAFKNKVARVVFLFHKIYHHLFRQNVYFTKTLYFASGRALVFVLPNERVFSACSRAFGRCLLFSLCFLSS